MNTLKHPTTMHFRRWLQAAQALISGFTVLIERRVLAPAAMR